MSPYPILVAGATGAQGGAVVDHLLANGVGVRALARDPSSPASRALAARGVDIAPGDFDDDASLSSAMRGVRGVFSVQMPPSLKDEDSEVRTGRKLIAAARAAGVETVVHTSVARAGDQETFMGWREGRWWPAYWNSKSIVNDAVAHAGFPHWVILKPAFMMDNFISPKSAWMFPELRRGEVATAMAPGTRLHLIAADDIGRFAAAAFTKPNRFHAQSIDLAAEALTMEEVATAIAAATGKRVVARTLSPAEADAAGHHTGLTSSQQWADLEGYKVDLKAARSHGLELIAFADWARRRRDAFAIEG